MPPARRARTQLLPAAFVQTMVGRSPGTSRCAALRRLVGLWVRPGRPRRTAGLNPTVARRRRPNHGRPPPGDLALRRSPAAGRPLGPTRQAATIGGLGLPATCGSTRHRLPVTPRHSPLRSASMNRPRPSHTQCRASSLRPPSRRGPTSNRRPPGRSDDGGVPAMVARPRSGSGPAPNSAPDSKGDS